MSKIKIKGKTLVVQLGRYMTQILLVNDDRVLHNVSVNTPAGSVEDGMIQNVEAVRAMLKENLRAPEFRRTHQVVFTVCTSQVITETTVVPSLPDSKLEKLLQANVDMYFPVDMRDYRLVWQTIGPVEREAGVKELAVQLWAVPIDMLAQYYLVGNGCGLNVLAVDYCGHAIATAVGASFSQPVKAAKKPRGKKNDQPEALPEEPAVPDTYVYMTLERDLLGMTFVQEEQVVHQRFIQCGENLAYQFGEIPMMVEYFRSLEAGRGSNLYGILTGTMAKNPRLITELQNMLGIPVETIDTPYEPRFTLCMGAVHTDLDFGMAELNKSSRAKDQLQSQLWQYGLILVGGAALIAAVMLTMSARLVWNANISSLKSSQQTLTVQAQKYAGYADNYKQYESLYNGYSSDWDNIFSSMRTYNNNLTLALQELEDTLPENSSVVALQINPQTLDVTFACETKEEAAYLIINLRKLNYADLSMITDLQGGGGGAATEYGSEEGEEPPTEGGNTMTQYQRSQVIDLIHDTTDVDAVWELVYNMSDSEAKLIEREYGASPTVSAASLASAKSGLGFSRRCAAVEELLTKNFYAIYHFVDMVKEDIDRDEPLLANEIMDDLCEEENEDILNALVSKKQLDGSTARSYNARLVNILIQDDEHLTATENLLASDSAMERWAIFYLETPESDYADLRMPYLDMTLVVDDLVEGGFNTGNQSLDAELDALIHEDVWAECEKYLDSGEYDASYPDKYTDAELKSLLKKYLDEGSSGDTRLDEMIETYLLKGTSGNSRLDDLINNYEDSDVPETTVPPTQAPTQSGGSDATEAPEETEATEPTTSGGESSGGSDYAAMIDKLPESTLGNMINKYLKTGTTGVAKADPVVEQYLETGTTGDSSADKKINNYLIKLIKAYNTNGTTGLDGVDDLIYKYRVTKDTGYDVINDLLWSNLSPTLIRDPDAKPSGTATGGSTGTGGQEKDTRVYFTATLTYKEELIEQEQARKGLDQDAKIEKLEVTEE